MNDRRPAEDEREGELSHAMAKTRRWRSGSASCAEVKRDKMTAVTMTKGDTIKNSRNFFEVLLNGDVFDCPAADR